MPPKGSKAHTNKNLLGVYQSNKKELNKMEKKIEEQSQVLLERNKVLEHENSELCKLNIEIKELASYIDSQKSRLAAKKKVLNCVKGETLTLPGPSSKAKIIVTKCVAQKRKMHPTHKLLPCKAKVVRRKETMDACMAIHGATKTNFEPAVIGVLDTLSSKCKAADLAENVLNTKTSLRSAIENKIIKNWNDDYSRSGDNVLRSLNTYYSHNVLGKVKYLSIRKANRQACFKNKRVPNYVSYKVLSDTINTVNIGSLYEVSTLIEAADINKVQGMYREPVDFILRLAKFYLTINEHRVDKLKTFDAFSQKENDSFLFVMALGGDGAPICGMSILISFLNVGERIASSSEQFLLFGADVEENSRYVSNFVMRLISDVKYLESSVFEVEVGSESRKVEFKLSELPNDMKMLAFLAGELSNSAQYFSTFGNVTKNDCNDHKKVYGPNGDWKPFSFKKRVEDAKKVAAKKKSFGSSVAKAVSQRIKVTSFISKELKSRQEFHPLVDSYIDCAKAEPLHLKNNTIKERFMLLFKICVAQSNLTNVKSFSDVQSNSLFSKFESFVHYDMQCNFLATKIKRWFNENCGKVEKEFGFRFRGKESFLFMKHFPSLVSMIILNVSNNQVKVRLHEIFFQSLRLRQLLSYAVRIGDFDEQMLSDMKIQAKDLFTSCCLFDQRISPSLWTLCNVAPYQAEKCLHMYKFGLGCNTMEGREQKHQQIAKYAQNTTFQNRWPLIFRHEFIQLIHLRENGFDVIKYNKKGVKYVPAHIEGCCFLCNLPLLNDKCRLCDSDSMERVKEVIKKSQ